MLELKGKYTSATIYADTLDEGTVGQVQQIIDSRAFKDQVVAVMPDAHAGKSGPCGLCATIGDFVNPDLVGCDIGCTVSMIQLDKAIPEELFSDFNHKVRNALPMGCGVQPSKIVDERDFRKFLTRGFNRYRQKWPEMLSELPDNVTEEWIDAMLKRVGMQPKLFWNSLGTVGSGNHFIEYQERAEGTECPDAPVASVTFHFGSRNFGQKVYAYWAGKAAGVMDNKEKNRIIRETKEEFIRDGRPLSGLMEEAAKRIQKESEKSVPGYLSGEQMRGYLMDVCAAQLYAEYNHKTAQDAVEKILSKKPYGIKVIGKITSVHNFIDLDDHVMRKSAIRSYEDELILVPFNMRDGVAVCRGKSNPEWLNSCAHGAGRKMSRNHAKSTLSMDTFTESMTGIYSTSVCPATLDESPQAYKDTDEIKRLIQDTCEILYMMVPKISMKDAGGEKPWQKKKR